MLTKLPLVIDAGFELVLDPGLELVLDPGCCEVAGIIVVWDGPSDPLTDDFISKINQTSYDDVEPIVNSLVTIIAVMFLIRCLSYNRKCQPLPNV